MLNPLHRQWTSRQFVFLFEFFVSSAQDLSYRQQNKVTENINHCNYLLVFFLLQKLRS